MQPLPYLMAALLIGQPAPSVTYAINDLRVTHRAGDEGLYYAPPATGAAYNTQIIRDGDRYHTVYHAEPRKTVGKGYPGDSIRAGTQTGDFSGVIPPTEFVLWGDPNDTASLLYSPEVHSVEGWGGVGNPMTVKGPPGDDYFYLFGVVVHDDEGDRTGNAHRHYLCQFRTKDFKAFDVRTGQDAVRGWNPFTEGAPPARIRPVPARDVTGRAIRSLRPTDAGGSQGLIGSICRVQEIYYFFYTDVEVTGETRLFYRTTVDPAVLDGWSEARVAHPGPLMIGTVVRVAKARGMDRWALLYNGYKTAHGGLRPDLMLQYTDNLAVEGEGGISGITFYEAFQGPHGIHNHAALGLASGTVYAQHYFMTDPYGNLDVPARESGNPLRGGLLTWTDLKPGVYGSKVYWAGWEAESEGNEE